MSLKPWQKAAGAAATALALVYAYNVRQNIVGGEQIHQACTSIRRSIDERMTVESLSMLVDDPPALTRDLRAEIDAPCITIEPRLAWWQWNLGARVPIPPDPARAARLEAIRIAMITKCVPLFRGMLDASNLTGASPEALAAKASESCDEIAGSLRSPTSDAGPPIPVWDWPDRLSALARSLAPTPESPESGAGAPPNR